MSRKGLAEVYLSKEEEEKVRGKAQGSGTIIVSDFVSIRIPQPSLYTQFLTPKPRFLITSALNLNPISHFSSTTPLDPSVPEIETQIEIPFDKLFVPPETDVPSLTTSLGTRILKGSNIVLSKYARDGQVAQAEFVKSSVRTEDCPAEGLPEFALVGRSNVGKSSLLNSLEKSENRQNIAT
ncbi:hypothetical protein RJ639_023389 [Escallonia herrerae]|uniref:G domain-containing protein n=1 Tax=Escallonia herrerae TaxID=1293975 RepID=A0AA89ADC7_9ASTE|nr:hypothetical protein RJ639_023389 [Escallonia herrerae]